jgi:hypothetical protein
MLDVRYGGFSGVLKPFKKVGKFQLRIIDFYILSVQLFVFGYCMYWFSEHRDHLKNLIEVVLFGSIFLLACWMIGIKRFRLWLVLLTGTD